MSAEREGHFPDDFFRMSHSVQPLYIGITENDPRIYFGKPYTTKPSGLDVKFPASKSFKEDSKN